MTAPLRLWPWLALAACAGAAGQTAPGAPRPSGEGKWAEWETVQKQLRLGEIRLSPDAVKAGEAIVATCELGNATAAPVTIPNNREFFAVGLPSPKNLLGLERWWIRRLGPDQTIQRLDREGKVRANGAYSNGQGVIQVWRTRGAGRLVTPRQAGKGEALDMDSNQQSLVMQPGESVELRAGNVVDTGSLPRGSYELSVEYLTLSGKPIASRKATFEVR